MTSQNIANFPKGLVWFRRDLRAHDQHALFMALKHCTQVFCAFVFDTQILNSLPKSDRRVEFIQESVVLLEQQLRELSSSTQVRLISLHGDASNEIPALASLLEVQAVFTNHDDEPYSVSRDAKVRGKLSESGISFLDFKDHVIFERSEVLTQTGSPYGVFTPYKNAWLKKISSKDLESFDIKPLANRLAVLTPTQASKLPGDIHSLKNLGFEPTNLKQLGVLCGAQGGAVFFKDFLKRMDRYHETRDFPCIKGPSYLGVHLRFGTVSIRELARTAIKRTKIELDAKKVQSAESAAVAGAAVWLAELIWRDFYAQILHHYPRVAQKSFKPEYDLIAWEDKQTAKTLFQAWCEGRTGYPLVDAAMLQINTSGYMHNRLRMVVASFLVKDLGIDWRWGEEYFAKHLIDFDLASNNGGWQWASSSGCDAQPYFRIFNPCSQSERFDPKGQFIHRYLTQLQGLSAPWIHAPWSAPSDALASAGITLGKDYPLPIVDHAKARQRTLLRYAVVKNKSIKASIK